MKKILPDLLCFSSASVEKPRPYTVLARMSDHWPKLLRGFSEHHIWANCTVDDSLEKQSL